MSRRNRRRKRRGKGGRRGEEKEEAEREGGGGEKGRRERTSSCKGQDRCMEIWPFWWIFIGWVRIYRQETALQTKRKTCSKLLGQEVVGILYP